MTEPILWAVLGLLAYTYAGYPALLWALTRWRPRPIRRAPCQPTVTIILAVHNEASTIRAKLENLLGLDYPRDLVQILVISDCSTDDTAALARAYSDRHIELLDLPERRGKHAAQHAGIQLARGDILVFTDAAATLERESLAIMMEYFADSQVGCVTSEDRVESGANHSEGEGLYIRYLMQLRRWESDTGSVVGLSGSFFGARRVLCDPWWSDRSSDFALALRAVAEGWRAVNAPDCRHSYRSTPDPGQEFRRKVRTVANGMLVLADWTVLLNPFRFPLVSVKLFSHKLCRWSVPLLLVVCLACSAALAAAQPAYSVLLALQLCFYLLALAGILNPSLGRYRAVRVPLFFCLSNAAVLFAVRDLAIGRRSVVWTPTRRTDVPL